MVKLSQPPYHQDWDGPPLFEEDGTLHIGKTRRKYKPGEWTTILVVALGEGPLSVNNAQAEQESMVRRWADIKTGPDPESVDIYFEVERSGGDDPLVQRGTPTFSGEELDVDVKGGSLRPGQWKKITIYSEGWAAREGNSDASTADK